MHIQKPKEIDRLFASLESTDLLIVDCRAASTDLFPDYFGEINLREVLGMLEARFTLVAAALVAARIDREQSGSDRAPEQLLRERGPSQLV